MDIHRIQPGDKINLVTPMTRVADAWGNPFKAHEPVQPYFSGTVVTLKMSLFNGASIVVQVDVRYESMFGKFVEVDLVDLQKTPNLQIIHQADAPACKFARSEHLIQPQNVQAEYGVPGEDDSSTKS